MKFLSHRGLWRKPSERNSAAAFLASARGGYGIETDVRDLGGSLVISHDPPVTSDLVSLDFALSIYDSVHAPLALNIKADGLASRVAETLGRHEILDAFVFDMSVPDLREYVRLQVPVFTRWSDVEPHPAYERVAQGIWLDALEDDDWWTPSTIETALDRGLRVCVVSPELHGRAPYPIWDRLRDFAEIDEVLLCTDTPDTAAQHVGSRA